MATGCPERIRLRGNAKCAAPSRRPTLPFGSGLAIGALSSVGISLVARSRPARDRSCPTLFAPILARTLTIHRPTGPYAHDCVRVIVVRDGSAILFSEFGQKPVKPGDVILLAANTLCGAEPEGHVTVSAIYADTDYVIDQVFWHMSGPCKTGLMHRTSPRRSIPNRRRYSD